MGMYQPWSLAGHAGSVDIIGVSGVSTVSSALSRPITFYSWLVLRKVTEKSPVCLLLVVRLSLF